MATGLTREQRAKRREKIAKEIDRGRDIDAVAQKHGVTAATVVNACREFGVDTALQHKQAAERRRKIAQEIRQGKDAAEVAQKFGVALTTVGNACREFGVEYSTGRTAQRRQPNHQMLQIVAWLIEGYNGADIAEAFSVSRQYVSQIRQQAREAGIFEAVESLDKAIPEHTQKMSDEVKFAVLADVMGNELTFQEIADRHGLHIATVFKISQIARESGVGEFAVRSFLH